MRSSFFEYNVAMTGFFTAKNNLEVVGHNIANSTNTKYSKQYAMQRASAPIPLGTGKGMVGTGSEVYGIGQYRDFYLDLKYWRTCGTLGEYSAKTTQLSLLESVFNELSDNGLSAQFENFFASLQDLTTTTDETTFRTNAIQAGDQLSTFINSTANTLRNQQRDLNDDLKFMVNEINNIANKIATLNSTIYKFEMSGDRANDLRDQRNALIDELSLYVNVDVKEIEFNDDYANGRGGLSDLRTVITINGYQLVNHTNAYELECRPRTVGEEKNELDVSGLYDLYFANTNQKFDIYSASLSGELKGLIDLRDGNNGTLTGPNQDTTTKYRGIPYYLNQLTELVRTFSKAINLGVDKDGNPIDGIIGHEQGYDKYGDTGKYSYFTYSGSGDLCDDYSKLNCFNFVVNPALFEDNDRLACYEDFVSGVSENKVILSWVTLQNDAGLFKEGKLSDFIHNLSVNLGIDKTQADSFVENYTITAIFTDTQRLSISGVSVDEETVDMVRFQQLYVASTKLVNVIDNIYDTLINRMGV